MVGFTQKFAVMIVMRLAYENSDRILSCCYKSSESIEYVTK